MHGFRPLFGAAVVFVFAAHLAAQNAQNQRAQSDHFVIETGARLYGAQCSACHGTNGDLINGVDLRAGRFLTARTDEDLARVLVTGRPAAGMPSFAVLHSDESRAIIAYIRSGFDAKTDGVRQRPRRIHRDGSHRDRHSTHSGIAAACVGRSGAGDPSG